MYPHDVSLFGHPMSIWNLTFVVGVLIGYGVLRLALRTRGVPRPSWLPLRWLVTVYVAVLGAQLFAYLFDLNTDALPPPEVGWVRYYLDPFFGPKTLYGAIVFLPLAVAIAAARTGLGLGRALDLWTPPVFAVFAVARVGCFLQGCCYGVPWSAGVVFPTGSPAYHAQHAAGLVTTGAPSLPIVPTQPLEALLLAVITIWSLRRLAHPAADVFVPAVAVYSVGRFLLEIVRDDPDRNVLGPLATSQWIALAVVAGLVLWRVAAAPARPWAPASSSPQ